jgi:hypothetical protein
MRISGKVMATAALNSRNAGFSIIVTRLLRSMTTNWPTWATANKPPAITAIGPAWVLSGDSDTRTSLEEIPPVGGSSRSTPTLATARAKRKGCAIVEQNPTLGNHRRMKERWRFTLRHIQPGVRWGGEARCSRRWIPHLLRRATAEGSSSAVHNTADAPQSVPACGSVTEHA